MKNISLKDAIINRKSVKVFDPEVKIPHETMKEMIQLATEAPSSLNLQPWRFVVIESDEAKEAIKGLVRFNERQRETSSAIILVLSDNEHYNDLEKIMQKNVNKGYMNQMIKKDNVDAMRPLLDSMPKEILYAQGMMDASMAAMQLMLIAKDYGYDTNPMGGFERLEVLEALNIDPQRYAPVMMIAIGKGVKDAHNTSRHEVEEIMSYDILTNEKGIIGSKKGVWN